LLGLLELLDKALLVVVLKMNMTEVVQVLVVEVQDKQDLVL
jgi:hypothetical protein